MSVKTVKDATPIGWLELAELEKHWNVEHAEKPWPERRFWYDSDTVRLLKTVRVLEADVNAARKALDRANARLMQTAQMNAEITRAVSKPGIPQAARLAIIRDAVRKMEEAISRG